jgi:16S rRNA (cytidine1402-2'-O)-methyltransferase
MQGSLFLIPTPISEEFTIEIITVEIRNVVSTTSFYAVENIRTARRFLKLVNKNTDIDKITFFYISKELTVQDEKQIIGILNAGNNIGVMSEAGTPGIADPGAEIAKIAHRINAKIVPLIGPSSIMLALTGSGLNGQKFEFHGYLPIKSLDRQKYIRNLEKDSAKNNKTQLFIETPYRNAQMFRDILQTCHTETMLLVAVDLTGKNQILKTKSILEWRKTEFEFMKKPAIFGILAL